MKLRTLMAAALVALAPVTATADDSIIVQSTTSTANSGLYDYLLPIFTDKTGITVNVVAPGFIQTDMTDALTDEQRAAMADKIALGRPGSPADIAGAVSFLLGPAGSYVTGQVLLVDGGLSLG